MRLPISSRPSTSALETEGDVVGHGHMGEQGIVLKHHPEMAPLRWQLGHILPGDHDRSLVRGFESRDQTQERGLATSAGSEQDEDLPFVNRQGDLLQNQLTIEALAQLLQSHER